MCGFAAVYSYSGCPVYPADLARMTHALAHRGPDDFGFGFTGAGTGYKWRDQGPETITGCGVAMGHRRLSILDLSEAGRQPFVSRDGRYWLVYNGEIFNYIELRDELKRLGHDFSTATDTEVVLCAYIQWGKECFNRFNGMWALLIWDSHELALVACRDRFGIKPLYYHRIDGILLFASEVKSILQHPAATREPDIGSVTAYLARESESSAEASFFQGVYSVKPGSWLSCDANGRIDSGVYWSLPERASATAGFDDAASGLRELLADSVRLRLRSDVRVGTMLSGGLDSTSVTALVAEQMAGDHLAQASTGESLHSFTASFTGMPIDETGNVDELCSQLPLTKHTVFPQDESEIFPLLESTIWSMERPWYNSVPIVHYLLMRRAREQQVSVVLNGHGADEVYAGYPYDYCPMAVADAVLGLRWVRAKRELEGMRKVHGYTAGLALGSIREQLVGKVKRYKKRGDSWSSVSIVRPELLKQYPSPPSGFGNAKTGLEKLLLKHFFEERLPGWLEFEDRISMAHSVEARLPFMDYRLVEYGFSLPGEFKIRHGQTKAILRRAMAGKLPGTIIGNSRKTPFSGPTANWLGKALRPIAEELMCNGQPLLAEFVDPAGLKSMFSDYFAGRAPHHHLWVMLNTEIWLRKYFAEKPGADILH